MSQNATQTVGDAGITSLDPTSASVSGVPANAINTPRRRKRRKLAPWMEDTPLWLTALKGLVLLAIALIMFVPFLNVVTVSLSSAKDVMQGNFALWPKNPTVESYQALLNGGTVLRSLKVTILLTIIGTAVQVALTTMMAYGLSKPGVPGSKALFTLVLVAFLFSPGMIPLFLLVKNIKITIPSFSLLGWATPGAEWGMYNSYAALVVPGLIGAWNLIILRNFFQNLPQDLLDAARVDGANDFGVFRHIALPLSKAVIAVIALFTGVGIWNTFFSAILYLTDSAKWPIQVVLRQYVLEGSSITSAADFAPGQPPPPSEALQMAMVVIATVPILLVYPFLQKYFAKGVLTGAIKG